MYRKGNVENVEIFQGFLSDSKLKDLSPILTDRWMSNV